MLKNYLSKVFEFKSYKIVSLGLLIIFICLHYPNSSWSLSYSIFNTIKGKDLDFILSNISWILFYLTGELCILPVLQQIFLASNPMILVRNPSRKIVFMTGIILVFLFSIIYNLAFILLQDIVLKTNTYNTFLLVNSTLSLITFTLLLLGISLLIKASFSWQIGIILALFSLVLKTNDLTLLTNPNNGLVFSNFFWLILLIPLIYALNQKIELK